MHWKILILSLALAGSALAQPTPSTSPKHPFTLEDMMKLKRVGAPVPSPDGKWVVFGAVDVDLEANTKVSHLWIVAAAGGEARRLNQTPNHEERPRFSPDGKRLIWTSKATDPTQIWMGNFTPESGGLDGQPHQVTNISTGADGGIWSPDGKNIVFLSSVYPDAKDDAENKKRDDEVGKSKVKAKIFTKLLYRHWTSYTEHKRSHLFVVSADGNDSARDLTPGNHDVPPFNLGGQDMYSVSPDGQELAYTSHIDEIEATSTNNEIFLAPTAGGTPKKISTSPGNDNTPVYSPDGEHIAWRSMARSGFEADKESLILYQRKLAQNRNATINFDRSVGSLVWNPDSKAILFTAEDHGEAPIWVLLLDGKQPKQVARLHADDLVFSKDGNSLFFSHASISAPSEIARLDVAEKPKTANLAPVGVTHINDAVLSQIDMQPMESFTFPGANNENVEGFIVRPPGFDSTKKYPLKFLLHAGPQGAWGDSWTYRWNAQLFAATGGYVVVMINFHGSTGYGQKFTDSISGDWGGKPYDDLMKGLDYVEKTYPFIDKNREAAMGASYGGFIWNMGVRDTPPFLCIFFHAGGFYTHNDFRARGEGCVYEQEVTKPPWKNRELYRKWSPHLFADKFKTPTLVVHGQLDFRLDVSEGFQLFTTLQRLKVPSKMLYFPDEGHWVVKPQNSRLWYKTVNDWVEDRKSTRLNSSH